VLQRQLLRHVRVVCYLNKSLQAKCETGADLMDGRGVINGRTSRHGNVANTAWFVAHLTTLHQLQFLFSVRIQGYYEWQTETEVDEAPYFRALFETKENVHARTGFNWLRTGSNGGLVWI